MKAAILGATVPAAEELLAVAEASQDAVIERLNTATAQQLREKDAEVARERELRESLVAEMAALKQKILEDQGMPGEGNVTEVQATRESESKMPKDGDAESSQGDNQGVEESKLRRNSILDLADAVMNGQVTRAEWEQAFDAIDKESASGDTQDIAGKFAGAIELSYSGLDTFFGGLEGLVGPPKADVMSGMIQDHTKGIDCNEFFVTGNYGVKTTSETEWLFVVDPDHGPKDLRLSQWPAESEKLLPEKDRRRQPKPLAGFKDEMQIMNEQLKDISQPFLR